MIHNIKRYLLTLVLLLTAASGAWATVYNSGEVNSAVLKVGDILYDVTIGNYFKLAANRYKYQDAVQSENSAPLVNIVIDADGLLYQQYRPVTADGQDGNAWVVTEKMSVSPNSGEVQVLLGGIFYDPNSVYPTTDAETEGATFTEASFQMPAYDATVSYELVRDLEQSVVFAGLPNTTQGTEILKKDGDKYTFATTPEIALVDAIDLENLLPITDAEGITLSYEMKNDADEWVAQPDDFDIATDAVPGTYRVVAKATTGAYDGTITSKEFTLAEAYDLTLSPANAENPYNIGKETAKGSVTVGQEEATPDEKGVIKGIEPGKKVKITTTGPDYIIRKATVKKTVKLQSIKIDGITIYYAEGDTWTTALQRDENKNCGVTIESGCMWSDTGILCDSDDAPVSADVEIKATESYSFQC